MRILIFAPYFPPHVGGLESFVSELNEVLLCDTEIARITVLTPRLPATGMLRESRGERYRVLRYPAFEAIPNFPVPKLWSRGWWRALREASPRESDLIVSHTRFFVTSALALACARLARRPLLHVEHGSDFVQLGSRVNRALARTYDLLLGRLVLRRADAVVAISRAAAEFVRRIARRDAHVIYRGMWPQRLAAIAPDPRVLEAAGGRQVVTFVGRMIDGKGVPDLMHAFAAVAGDGAILCLVGDGPRREDLERMADGLHIAERVHFLGYLKEADALGAILASDVIVNPSYTEGLPTTVLEAAFLGRAVLATDVGGTPEVVADGESAVLVPPRDVEALGRELERLLGDRELRERLGARARINAEGRFDWEIGARRFIVLGRSLVGAGPPPRD